MASGSLKKVIDNHYIFEEVAEVGKDKKNIKATGFEQAYENFKKALPHILSDQKQWYQFHGLHRIEKLRCNCEAYVAKKIRWKDARSRLRVVFCVKDDIIKIVEIYFKGQADNENKDRICKYCH